MSIKVELYLNDQQERDWFGELMNAIDHWRAQKTGNIVAVTHQQNAEKAAPAEEEAAVIAHIAPDPNSTEPTVTKPAAGSKVSYEELEKVVMVYLNKNGVPATRKVIADFGYPQLKDVPAEEWATLKMTFEGLA